jgi:hypothetical protein
MEDLYNALSAATILVANVMLIVFMVVVTIDIIRH